MTKLERFNEKWQTVASAETVTFTRSDRKMVVAFLLRDNDGDVLGVYADIDHDSDLRADFGDLAAPPVMKADAVSKVRS